MTDKNTISKVIESLFEDWIDKNINVHPLAVENMRILEADALALLKEQGQRIEELEIDRDILVQDINFHNCNTCKRQCEIRPEPGEVVRVNCYLWSEKEHT